MPKPAVVVIECKIQRKNGSTSVLDGIEYHFRPRGGFGAAHVDLVANPEHVERFLAVGGASYRMHSSMTEDGSIIPLPGTVLPEDDADAPGLVAPQPEPEPAPEPTKATSTPPIAADPQGSTTAPAPEPEPAAPAGGDPGPQYPEDDADASDREVALAALENDALRAEFERVVGRKPSQKAKPSTMIANILSVEAESKD